MKYLFIPNPNGDKVKNGVRGILREFADDKIIRGPLPVLTSTDGITDYVEPPK